VEEGRVESDVKARLFRRLLALQAFWSFERMQSLGLLFSLDPGLKRAHEDPSEYRKAALRHLGFFNTNPYMAGFVAAMVSRLEEDLARGPQAQRRELEERIEQMKRALGASLAGIGDAFFWGTLRPACAAAAALAGLLAWRAGGPAPAAATACAVYLTLFNVPALWTRWKGITVGYAAGERLAEQLAAMRWQRKTRWAARAGLAACLAACALTLAAPPWGGRGTAWEAGTLALCAALRAGLPAPAVYAVLAVAAGAASAGGL
jgi:PTS system mannose-specific IID component